MRVSRLGWSSLTAAARSCTEMATVIREAMETSKYTKSSNDFLSANFSMAVLAASATTACSNSVETNSASPLSFEVIEGIRARKAKTCACASARAAATARSLRAASSDPMRSCSAENTMANPNTMAMSSSGDSCSSLPASSNVCAIENEMLTERSEPIEERAPAAVPPTPPVVVEAIGQQQSVTAYEYWLSSKEGNKFLIPLFSYQGTLTVYLRRLVLTPASRKRKASATVLGQCFGVPIGMLVDYLSRGVKGERATILRKLRAVLLPAAENLVSARGEDARMLALGMAAAKVAVRQREELPETKTMKRIDAKYGDSWVAMGATAALIAAFSCMIDVPNHARFIAWDESFIKALRCAEQCLSTWDTAALTDTAVLASLAAERRALERAIQAARGVAEFAVQRGMAPFDAMRLQLKVSLDCAFPPGAVITQHTQPFLLDVILRRTLACTASTETPEIPKSCWDRVSAVADPHCRVAKLVATLGAILPLAALPASLLTTDGAGGDSESNSACSGSWTSVSNASSRASNDSLGSLNEAFEVV